MGGNQSKQLNEDVTEVVSQFINSNTTSFVQKIENSNVLNQDMYNKFQYITLKNCTLKIGQQLVNKTSIKLNTDMEFSNEQISDLTNKLKDSLKSLTEQMNKELNIFQENRQETENRINQLLESDIRNIVSRSFKLSIVNVNEQNQRMKNEIKVVKCTNSIIEITQGMSYENVLEQIVSVISEDIQKNKVIDDMKKEIDAAVKQKNMGINITLALIAAMLIAVVYLVFKLGLLNKSDAKKAEHHKKFLFKLVKPRIDRLKNSNVSSGFVPSLDIQSA